MSLIIVRKLDSMICAVSDMKLTGTDKERIGDNTHEGLKIFFIGKRFLIAYANATKYAHQIIKSIEDENKKYSNEEQVAARIFELKQIQKRATGFLPENSPDFIVSGFGPATSIYRIADDNSPELALTSAWIGDKTAFETFQRNFHSLNYPDIRQRTSEAFSLTVRSGQHDTIGGYPLTIIGDESGFRYQPEMALTSPSYSVEPPKEKVPGSGTFTVMWGTAQTGGFAFTTVTPKARSVNGFGIFYFQGKFGLFYRVDIQNDITECLKAYAHNVAGFIKVIENEIGIELEAYGSLG